MGGRRDGNLTIRGRFAMFFSTGGIAEASIDIWEKRDLTFALLPKNHRRRRAEAKNPAKNCLSLL